MSELPVLMIFGVEHIGRIEATWLSNKPWSCLPNPPFPWERRYLKRENKVIGGKLENYYVPTPKGLDMLKDAKRKLENLWRK